MKPHLSGGEGYTPNCCWFNKVCVCNCLASNACSLISAIAFFSRIFSSCDSWLCVEHFSKSWPSTVTTRPRQPILWYSEHRQNTLCPDCRSVLYIKPLWTSWYLPLELLMSCRLPLWCCTICKNYKRQSVKFFQNCAISSFSLILSSRGLWSWTLASLDNWSPKVTQRPRQPSFLYSEQIQKILFPTCRFIL